MPTGCLAEPVRAPFLAALPRQSFKLTQAKAEVDLGVLAHFADEDFVASGFLRGPHGYARSPVQNPGDGCPRVVDAPRRTHVRAGGTDPGGGFACSRSPDHELGDSSIFDAGQETPAPPGTPAPGPDPYPDGPQSSRFLLGDGFGLRPLLEERGLSFYVSSTQFEQGVAAGGLRQAFRWGGKFDMLAHLDSDELGLWEGGTLDLFAESRLGQSVDGFAGGVFADEPGDVLPRARPADHGHHRAQVHAGDHRAVGHLLRQAQRPQRRSREVPEIPADLAVLERRVQLQPGA